MFGHGDTWKHYVCPVPLSDWKNLVLEIYVLFFPFHLVWTETKLKQELTWKHGLLEEGTYSLIK